MEGLEARRVLATVSVNTYDDVVDSAFTSSISDLISNPGTDGDISLREAILAANNGSGTDIIQFSGITGTLTLTGGELFISDDLTIDGPGAADDLTINAATNSRIFHISAFDPTSILVTIKDLTLTGGNANDHGGAVYCYRQNLTLDGVVIEENSTSGAGNGGGVYASLEGGQLVVTGSTFRDNEGSFGGGLFVEIADGGDVEISSSLFELNDSGGSGGGVSIQGAGSTKGDAHISDSVFRQNDAYSAGGGISAGGLVDFWLERSLIEGNTAGGSGGGGLYLGTVSSAKSFVLDSTFYDNTAGTTGPGALGGGVYVFGSGDAEIVNTTISHNRALYGGGLYITGGDNSVAVRHSTIAYNTAGPLNGVAYSTGGGVVLWVSVDEESQFEKAPDVSFDHSIIAGNVHNQSDPEFDDPEYEAGVGDTSKNYAPDLSILARRVAGIDSLPSYFYPEGSHAVEADLYAAFGSVTFNKTIVSDLTGPFADEYLVTVDAGANDLMEVDPNLAPLADYGGPDLPGGETLLTHALLAGSPAIDAGDYALNSYPDIDGNSLFFDERGNPFDRVFDWPDGNLGRIDIGAYERQFVDPGNGDADFDEDDDVDGIDFLIWQRGLGIASGALHGQGDADFDGDVDVDDLFIWRLQFGDGMSSVPNANFNSTGGVNAADFLIWQANVGMATDADLEDGDADNDNDVDVDDYLAWQIAYSIETGLNEWMIHTLDVLQLAELNTNQSNPIKILVSTLVDENDGDYSLGDLSLREALAIADATSGTNEIVFANHLAGAITLSGTSLWVTSSVNIIGPGAGALTIDANGGSQVFAVNNSSATLDVTISGLTITGGDLGGTFEGAGIYSYENLTLDGVVVKDNVGGRSGGGLFQAGTGNLTILNSTFDNNSALWGGGAALQTSGSITIKNSTFSNNDAVTQSGMGGSGGGAGLYLQNNSSGSPAQITNSTFSGNVAQAWAGGIVLDNAYAVFTNDTIAFNDAAGTVGGVWRYSGGLTLHNTIVAKNTIGGTTNSDVAGTLVASSSYNLFGAGVNGQTLTGSGNQIGTPSTPIDPKLAALAGNGGSTKTHKLLHDSTAIDQASLSQALVVSLTADQRGYNRYVYLPGSSGTVDIGAYEYGLIVTSTSDTLHTTFARNDFTLRDALSVSAWLTTATVDQIEFASGLGNTITLGGTALSITSSVEIIGPGADLLTINANGASQVIAININNAALDVTIRGLTVKGGNLNGTFEGSGIYSYENLTLDGVVVKDNVGGRSGGGLFQGAGNLTILDSTFDNNSALWGGGAALQTTGNITIKNSTFSNNDAVTQSGMGGSGGGGGLYLKNNSSSSPAQITNSTFSGNVAQAWVGGIVLDNAYAVFTNDTIVFNNGAATTGGIWRYSGGLTLHNTIVAKNTIGGSTNSDIAGTLVASSSHNLFGAGVNGQTLTGAANQLGTPSVPIDPKLEALADNGGSTWTHKLENDSPAIDAADAVLVYQLVYDQRRSLRFDDGNGDAIVGLDIGAFELSADEYFEEIGA
jgi:hypothetical protein